MKRVLSLLFFALVINSCDDGNLIQEDISFEDVKATQSCSINNIIYKLKDKEALLLEIPKTSFVNEETVGQDPIKIEINKTNRVVYRFYDGTVSANNICETIPPATPLVVDQWVALNGIIEITTVANRIEDLLNNSTKISGYTHSIIFRDITFSKNNGTQVYQTFPFGSYVTPSNPLNFAFDKTLDKCSTSNQVYNYTPSEALMLNIDPSLIINEATVLNKPRIGVISSTTNSLTYRLFGDGLLSANYFCNTTTPATPTVKEEWIAAAGISDVSGIIEVTTTSSGTTGFKHTIVLKKVTFTKGNNSFMLGDVFAFGDLYTAN